jgi:hypothetical protein
MAILVIFLLGIGNFAMHKAVLESGHPMFAGSLAAKALGGKASMAAEFAILLAAMLLVANGHAGWGWAYFAYSAMNAVAAWLVLTGRI